MKNSIYPQFTILFVLSIFISSSYSRENSFNQRAKFNANNYQTKTTENDNNDDDIIQPIKNKNIPNYSCRNKEDDGYYEHEESCHKYWHCLYVDTIFERAFERKCPVGTMFHPLERTCEISTMLTCMGWKKSIYGKDYMEQLQQQESSAAAAAKLPPPPPPQPPLPPPSSLEILEPAAETNNEIQVNDYEAFLQFKNSLKTSSKKSLHSTSKTVIFKAYLTTAATTSYSQEQSSSEEYPDMIDTTMIVLPSTTEKKSPKKVSLPTKKAFSTLSTTTSTTTSKPTTSTSTTAKLVNKKYKTFKTKTKPNVSTLSLVSTLASVWPTPSTTTTLAINLLPFLEEKISEKLNYLSSNKLNSTQIFDEINLIKNLFNEHAKIKEINSTLLSSTSITTSTTTSTSSSTSTSTTTISTTTTTSTSTKMKTFSTSTTQKPTPQQEAYNKINNSDINGDSDADDDDVDDYDYESAKLSIQKNNRQFLPLLFVATTESVPAKGNQPSMLHDYTNEDDEQHAESNLNKKFKDAKNHPNTENNSLKTNELIAENFEPLEADPTDTFSSSYASLVHSNWPLVFKLALLLIIIIF